MRKRRWVFLGAALVVIVAAAFGYQRWAASAAAAGEEVRTATIQRGDVSATIDAGGTLTSPQVEALAWGASGVVETVLVAVGDQVEAGQVLMELDPESLGASVIQAQAELLQAEQALADILDGPSASELAAAEMRAANAQDALDEAQRTWTYQQAGNRGSGDTIAAAEARLVLADAEVDRAQERYNTVSGMREDSPERASALIQLVSARQARDAARRSLAWYTGHPTDTQQALLDASVAAAEAELAEARQALSDLEAGPDPVEVATARARLAAAQEAAAQSRIVAPFAGTVVSISSFEGDVVAPNSAAMSVADLSRLRVSMDVSELEIGQIGVGQEAQITIDALPDLVVRGTVSNVSIVGTSSQGVVTYPVTVTIEQPDPALQPGMTAAVSLVIEKRENVLLVPNRAVQVSGGQDIVTVMYQGQQIPVAVTLGLQGDSYSEVLEGTLLEGDVVVLNTTSSSQTSSAPMMGGAVFIQEVGGGGMPPDGVGR